jgi:hypothetical protein
VSSIAPFVDQSLPSLGRTATVFLIEGALASDGGFEETIWQIRVNDGWMQLDRLVRRGTIGGITAAFCLEDDPSGMASARHYDLKPRVYWKRETEVQAPVGTRFRKQRWVPNRERARQSVLLLGVPYDRYEAEFELRAHGLVSSKILAEKAQREADRATPAEKPMTAEELHRNAAELLASLCNRR